MTTIVVSDLHPIDVRTYLYELNPAQVETICGGNIFQSSAGYLQILVIHDGVNNVENTVEGASGYVVRDNKFYTIDYSRTTYILLL
ncbi:hypothetical protein VB735_33290 [Halotia wernerae UHCC 0503]|nr:hypothetical protein [Halotia wernerae UHCC 0503]